MRGEREGEGKSAMPNGWVYMSGELMSNGLGKLLFFLMARQRLHELPVCSQPQGGSIYRPCEGGREMEELMWKKSEWYKKKKK